MDKDKKRIIVPDKTQPALQVETIPDVERILSGSLAIYETQIASIQKDILSGKNLENGRARILNDIVKNLVTIAKEQRESRIIQA